MEKQRGKLETGFKEQIVQEVDSGLGSVGAAGRKHQISGSVIDRWRRQSRQGGLALLAGSSILLAVRKSDSSGFPVNRDSPQRPSAAEPQPKRKRHLTAKNAKVAKVKTKILRTWRALRLGASQFPCSSISAQIKLRRPRKFSTVEGRLGGANSGPCFTQKPEEPKKLREI